jgi:hypothetical protein
MGIWFAAPTTPLVRRRVALPVVQTWRQWDPSRIGELAAIAIRVSTQMTG